MGGLDRYITRYAVRFRIGTSVLIERNFLVASTPSSCTRHLPSV